MRIRKTFISLAAILLALIVGASSALAEFKLAYVDLQEALLSINEGKDVKSKLEKMATTKKKELETTQTELQTLKEELEKQGPMMKEDVRRKKLTEFQEKVATFQENLMNSQKELAAKEQEMTRPLLQKMISIVEEMAKELGYDMILEKGGVVYALSNVNLTDELIKRYNTKHKGTK
jgi:outer membrane protein